MDLGRATLGAAGISASGSLLGSLLGLFSNDDTNETNLQIARNNALWNAEQAKLQRNWASTESQKQRDWQTEMSNTAYQRAKDDLQAAGINPLLAVGAQSSTPSGGMASGSSASVNNGAVVRPYSFEGVAQAANSIADYVTKKAQLDNLAADTQYKETETLLKKLDALPKKYESEISARIKQNILDQLTGEVNTSTGLAAKPYTQQMDNAVQGWLNKLETDRYINSKERAVLLDVIKGGKDFGQLLKHFKSIK